MKTGTKNSGKPAVWENIVKRVKGTYHMPRKMKNNSNQLSLQKENIKQKDRTSYNEKNVRLSLHSPAREDHGVNILRFSQKVKKCGLSLIYN